VTADLDQAPQEERICADDVAKIEIMPYQRRLPHTDNPSPQTPLQGKFSVQYAVARALLDGAVRLADFEGDVFRHAHPPASGDDHRLRASRDGRRRRCGTPGKSNGGAN
jgi:hypothetical protein